MPELTPNDRESYQKLYAAARTLSDTLSNIPEKVSGKTTELEKQAQSSLLTLVSLTEEFLKGLLPIENLSNFEKLQAQVETVGGYLALYKIFAKPIDKTSNKASVNEAYQKLLMEHSSLKIVLEAADDDFVDEVVPICSDPLFLGFLEDIKDGPKSKTWTQQLISDQAPAFTEKQVQALVEAWAVAVSKVLEDAKKQFDGGQVNPGQSNTIAHLFCIHDQLEGLYSQLSTAVSLSS